MSKFQIIIIAIFVIGLVVAFLMFAGVIPGMNNNTNVLKEKLYVWGPFPEKEIKAVLNELGREDKLESDFIIYTAKNPETYESELINAMASGQSPDIFFINQDMLAGFKDKIEGLPFANFSERDFMDTFFDSAVLFTDKNEGKILAFPYFIDPLVLYWNKDLFSSVGLSQPPRTWIDFQSMAPLLTKLNAGAVFQAGAGMGEFANIKNAEDIISMMILQTGNSVIDYEKNSVVWNTKEGKLETPLESSLRFFTGFANPKQPIYSWNRSLNQSDVMFTGGLLAMYFGRASELESIKARNPHLNFDVIAPPQISSDSTENARFRATYADIYALAVSKSSTKKQSSFLAIYSLISGDINKPLADSIGLVPPRRDLLAEKVSDPFMNIFYQSAIMAKSWIKPDKEKVSGLFKTMIESITSGKSTVSESASSATKQLQLLLK
ncbi:MAG: extracellular solute-binding protein [Patescibacteria group bacterium]